MKLEYIKVMSLLAVTAVVPTTSLAASRSHKVNIKASFKQTGTKLDGKYSGSPWGSGKVTGKLVIPHATIVLHTKLGNATLEYDGGLKGTKVTGKWKFTRGTGKLAHIKGSGKAVGTLSGSFTYTGTATY